MAVQQRIYSSPTYSAGMCLAAIRYSMAAPPPELAAMSEAADRILRSAGLDWARCIARPDLRIPHEVMEALSKNSVAYMGEQYGLLSAEYWEVGDNELVGFMMMTSANLAECIEVWRRYHTLCIPTSVEVVHDGDRVQLRFRAPLALNIAQPFFDGLIASTTINLRNLVGATFRAMGGHASFVHGRPSYGAEYDRILGVPVEFGAEFYGLSFEQSWLQCPVLSANPQLHAVLRRNAERNLEALPDRRSLAGQVRAAIEAGLSNSTADLVHVSKLLGMHPDSLRRKLRVTGAPFRVMLEQARRDVACRLLEDVELTLSMVAQQVGFAGLPQFHRAFKGWYGQSPGEYRRSHHFPVAGRGAKSQ